MKTIFASVVLILLATVQGWSAPVPYSEAFDGYAEGDTAVANFTEVSTARWGIVSGSFSGKAYENHSSAFSPGVGLAQGINSSAAINLPDIAAASFSISTMFRIDTLTLTGSDPANTSLIGLVARAADAVYASSGADRYDVRYLLDDTPPSTAGKLYLDETHVFASGGNVSAVSPGTLPVVLGEIYTFTFSGTVMGSSLLLEATLSKSGGGSVSVSATDSSEVLGGANFGYLNFVYVVNGGTTTLNADFDNFTAAVPEPSAPRLTIRRSGIDVILSWPVPSTGFVLRQNPAIGTTNWTDVGTSPTTNGPNLEVLVPSPVGNRFYRLRHP